MKTVALLLLALALAATGCATAPKAAARAPTPGMAVYRNDTVAFKITCEERATDGHRVVCIEPLTDTVERLTVSSVKFHRWPSGELSCHVDAILDYSKENRPYYLAREFTTYSKSVANPASRGQKYIDLRLPEANYEIRYVGNVSFSPDFKRELNMLKLWETSGPVDYTNPNPVVASVDTATAVVP